MTSKILAVGEVLWDLLPTGRQLGGAPANFAYHARGLGLDARLVSRVGDDDLGQEVFDRFRVMGLPVEGLQVDPARPTGTVGVEVDSGGHPQYTIVEGVAWDAIEASPGALDLARSSDAVCFGSLAQRAEGSRSAILAIVAAAPSSALRVFDVNLRPPFGDRDVVRESLELANALKLNDDELPRLAALFDVTADDDRGMMDGLAVRFGLDVVALTRGKGGSLIRAGGAWSDQPGRPVEVVDSVGAGDSFTAALVVGLLRGDPLDAINRHANAVASFVCTMPGATPVLPDHLLRRPGDSPSLSLLTEARP